MAPPPPGPATPAWTDIVAHDALRLRRFYADLLGWVVTVEPSLDYGLVSDSPHDAPRGGIGPVREGGPHPPGMVSYFPVTDLDHAVARAEDAGGSVAVPPWELPGLGRMAVVLDPEGNRVGLMQA